MDFPPGAPFICSGFVHRQSKEVIAMKKLMLSVVVVSVLLIAITAQANPIGGDCTFKGIRLYGKVQIVDAFPDIKIQIVTAFPDLKVKKVDAFPDSCGKWQRVEASPDFKVQIVDAFPDIKVQWVDAFPGKP
jgi:hypothetical protein